MTTNENFTEEPYDHLANRPAGQDYLPDISLMDHYHLEFSYRFYPKVDYYSLNYDQTVVDDLRGEVEDEVYFDMLRIPINFEKNPQEKTLNIHGEQHNRVIEIHVSTAVLKHVNLNPKIGDIIVIEDAGYKVIQLQKENYFAGSNQPLSYLLYTKKTDINTLPIQLQEKYYSG